jgi:phage terminase large subunit-like protein
LSNRPSRPEELPAEWVELLRSIPGYDPFVGAEGCWFDIETAQLALDFFPEMLCHIEGDAAGKPFVLGRWQQAWVANLFGWKRLDDKGREIRRYKETLLYIPRKNGKTPTTAGLGLGVFFCDDEPGQQGYIVAKDRDQAGLLFRQMDAMVEANDSLKSRCRAYGGNAPAGASKSLVKSDNSFLKVISADAKGKHGGTPHLVIVDELHEQEDRQLIDTLRTSMTSANRKQGLMVYLTTADFDRPSICNERYEYAKRVQADPSYDPAFLPVIYEAEPGDSWADEKTWEKCNPNLDVSVSRAELRRLANEAKDNPALLIEFRRLHTNVRVQKTVDNAIELTLWDACKIEPPAVGLFAGQPCWGGLDLGWRDDFAALVRLWQLKSGGMFSDFRFWLPKGGKRDLRLTPFREFVARGYLTLTEGNTTDFAAIRAVLDETREQYELRKLMMDPSYARSEATELMNNGFPLEEFGQNCRFYSIPWKWLVADGLKSQQLRHDGNPVARWMAGHVAITINGADGVMPLKRKSKDKIDGITALCMGLAAWLNDPAKDNSNVYDTRMPLII